jgi:hypothetical protein
LWFSSSSPTPLREKESKQLSCLKKKREKRGKVEEARIKYQSRTFILHTHLHFTKSLRVAKPLRDKLFDLATLVVKDMHISIPTLSPTYNLLEVGEAF